MSRLIIFGIDGASLGFVQNLSKKGSIPNINRLLGESVKANLRPSTPLNSASIWTTIITGLNPGHHGIFGFMNKPAGGFKLEPASLAELNVPALWDIAGFQGARVGMINYPLTYPPMDINGFVVSGILIPYNDLFASPAPLKNALDRQFGSYLVDVAWAGTFEHPEGRDRFLDDLYHMCRKREEAILHCMDMEEWDILLVVFTGTDRLMHSFWHHIDEKHPMYNALAAERYGNEIEKYFNLVDSIIGRALNRINENDHVVLVSDHGFGPCYRNLHLGAWLEKQGYLKLKKPAEGSFYDKIDAIDWKDTQAYPAPVSDQGIYLNIAGREPAGIVSKKDACKLCSKIKKDIKGFIYEEHPVLKDVLTCEELFGSNHSIGHAADLYLVPTAEIDIDDKFAEEIIDIPKIGSGMHIGDGLFTIKGPAAKDELTQIGSIRAEDVLPTLLAVQGLGVPEKLDGKVSGSILKEGVKIKYLDSKPPLVGRISRKGNEEHEESLKRHLKGLGYL